MTLSPRTPVLVGNAQLTIREPDLDDPVEPLEMMRMTAASAAHDAGSDRLLERASIVAVVRGAWSYSDPGRSLARSLGAPSAHTILTTAGGQTPQALLNAVFGRIARGEADVVLLAGAEAIYSRRRLREAGRKLASSVSDDGTPDEVFGTELNMTNGAERAIGVQMPVQAYPLFENAIRFARGETIDAHRERIARLWSAFSRVAAENPFAWSRKSLTPEEVMTPSPTNRMIGYPYTKCMNSNWFLDQSAALIACSVETARSLGVPRDRWIFPHAGAGANDTEHLSNRLDLHSSPAIGLAGRRALELAGVELDSVGHIDLYSCFPSAVEISAAELGFDERRQLTVTGGLSFAGGPLNNYVMHSVATMMDVLRGDPGSLGLVTAAGGFLTNHAIGLYSSEPPRERLSARERPGGRRCARSPGARRAPRRARSRSSRTPSCTDGKARKPGSSPACCTTGAERGAGRPSRP